MLSKLREEIDNIDKELVKLFEQRMDVAKKVGEYKKENNLEILNAEREKEVIKSRLTQLKTDEYKDYAVDFFSYLMSKSRALQSEIVGKKQAKSVCYCGDPGCYAEEAGVNFFGKDTVFSGAKSFAEVFKNVETGEAEFGVLPVENTSTGSIRDVLDLLATYNCSIIGETAITISHCLLGTPDAEISDIIEIYSHEQGLAQSAEFLDEHQDIKKIPYINTATSAKLIASLNDKTKAAIASERAAQLYGLKVLKHNINQKKLNTTRFIIIGKNPEINPKADKISVAFCLEHKSGSLCRVLSHFSGAGLNLLHIESRPLPDRNYEYLFHIDFSGNLQNENVKKALMMVKKECSMLKVFGNFESYKNEELN